MNYQFEEMAQMDRYGGKSGRWGGVQQQQNKLKMSLRELIPVVMDNLEKALGRTPG